MVIVIPFNSRLNYLKITLATLNDAMSTYVDDYMILLDSDTLVHPQAIEKFKQMIADNSDLGIGSLFNTINHSFLEKNTIIYGEKEVLGGFGWIINKVAWDKYCKKIVEHWDVSASKNISESGEFKNYCTINSYLEHIGFNGTHKNEKEIG